MRNENLDHIKKSQIWRCTSGSEDPWGANYWMVEKYFVEKNIYIIFPLLLPGVSALGHRKMKCWVKWILDLVPVFIFISGSHTPWFLWWDFSLPKKTAFLYQKLSWNHSDWWCKTQHCQIMALRCVFSPLQWSIFLYIY